MIHLTENFGDLLDARFRKIFSREYAENIKESMIPMLYNQMTTTKNYEMMSGVGGGSDLATFDGNLSYDTIGQLWDKTTYFPEKAKGMKIQRKLYDDDLSGLMDRRPWQMAVDVARTQEKEGAEPFNDAFTGTGGADGVCLCSASHPYSPDDATTQSNYDVLSFNATNVEASRRLSRTAVFNDRGELMEVNYDTILCTVFNEEKAWELIESKGKVDTDINNRNFHEGRYKLAIWDRLTGSYPWFQIDSVLAKMFLIHWTRIAPEFNYDRDFDTYQAKWSVYKRENFDFYAHQWIRGHNATS